MLKTRTWIALSLLVFLVTGCWGGVTLKSYVKDEAPWDLIQRIGVLPFETPSESPGRRSLITHLFSEELRNAGLSEVIEVPLSSPLGGAPDLAKVGREYQVDAVFSGSIDETHGTVVHVRLLDAATSDVLWSGTYLLGVRAEFFSLKTQQQQFQRAFAQLVRKFTSETGI